MQRRPLNRIAPLVLLASSSVLALASASACSTSPSTGSPAGGGTTPTAGSIGTGGAGAGAGTGGIATGGTVMSGGGGATGGVATGGTSGAGMGGGGGGTDPVAPICKAGVTAINGSGLTLNVQDISAFKFANSPPGTATKMAYDPVGKDIVVLTQDGKMYSAKEPAVPTSMMTMPLATMAVYNSGYTPAAGYGQNPDHRGIVFGPDGTLYVLAVKGGADVGVSIRKGVPGAGGGARTWTDLVTTNGGFPAGGTNFDHSFSGIAISPDGMSLYFSSGSRSDHGEMEAGMGEVPLSSAVFKVPTGTPTELKNDMTALAPFLFADGTRNSFDMAFNAAGDLIATENGPDMDLPDEVNFLQQGKHYGFPYRFSNINNPVAEMGYSANGDKRLHAGYQAVDTNKYVYDASLAPPQGQAFVDPIMNSGPDAIVARADRNADPAPAAAGLAGVTGHRSPLGIAFDVAGASCGAYYKQGFMLSYGALKSDSLGDAGKDLLLLTLKKNGDAYTMSAKQLAKGIESPMDSVLVGNKLYTIGYGGAPMYMFVLPTP